MVDGRGYVAPTVQNSRDRCLQRDRNMGQGEACGFTGPPNHCWRRLGDACRRVKPSVQRM